MGLVAGCGDLGVQTQENKKKVVITVDDIITAIHSVKA